MIEQKPGSGPLGGEVPWTDLHVGDDLSDLRETAHSVRFGRWRIRFQGMTIHCHDLMSFYYSARDIFLGGLYDFGNPGGKARIIDGGAHIGLFSLFAARQAPESSIIAFEPNPTSLEYLRLNIQANGLEARVEVKESGLAATEGQVSFKAGESDDSSMCSADTRCSIRTVRLSKWLEEPVAVLKLNIEGAECEVIEESEAWLRSVEKIFIEYHGFPELPQTLHRILATFDRAGFRYCLGAMDLETNPVCHPPFILGQRRFFNLAYAQRQERA